jgi:hypothetical protein
MSFELVPKDEDELWRKALYLGWSERSRLVASSLSCNGMQYLIAFIFAAVIISKAGTKTTYSCRNMNAIPILRKPTAMAE